MEVAGLRPVAAAVDVQLSTSAGLGTRAHFEHPLVLLQVVSTE